MWTITHGNREFTGGQKQYNFIALGDIPGQFFIFGMLGIG